MRLKQTLIASSVVTVILAGSPGLAQESRQGWTSEEREAMYFGTQGSRLIPKSWLDALEIDDGTAFASVENLMTYGLLAPPDDAPSSYPIGLAIDQQSDRDFSFSKLRWYKGQGDRDNSAEPWVGLNCTACHTGSYLQNGKLVTVDGAPGMFDLQSFIEGLDGAMSATQADSARWARFAETVLGSRHTAENEAMLKTAFNSLLEWEKKTEQMNQTDLRSGFGRVDAVGHILNKVLMFTGSPAEAGNAANAPVSYPFLWNMWRQKKVQWNGSVENNRVNIGEGSVEYGALGRNTGEVIGVFGDVILKEKSLLGGLSGYESSVDVTNLMRMELVLKKLEPPAWPDGFPKIDKAKADQGELLFRNNCASCHLTKDMQKPDAPTERMISFINTPKKELTDIWMACNAYVNVGPTGPLNGTKDLTGAVMGDEAPVFNMLGAVVKGTLLGSKGALIKEVGLTFFGIERLPIVNAAPSPFDPRAGERATCMTTPGVDILGYKARPLDGIWATAPYLHNGSVASLYELLLPAEQRLTEFWVGNREYDTTHLGYVNAKPASGGATLLQTQDANGRRIEGNGNQGHEYGAAGFSDQERWALIEYLKSL
jgi:hypothetical protein